MQKTKFKGCIGELKVIEYCTLRGYEVYMPFAEYSRCDLIVFRNNKFERVQCKYTESDGNVVLVRSRSVIQGDSRPYTSDEIDYIAVYDKTTDKCYFVPIESLEHMNLFSIRLKPTKNNQVKGIHQASEFVTF